MGSPLRVLALERMLAVGEGGWLDEPELARSVTALESDVAACLAPLRREGWLERRATDAGVAWRIATGRRGSMANHLAAQLEDEHGLLARLRRVQQGPMGTIVGFDPRMKMVFEKARIAARAQVPVLVEGSCGTGKRVVAEAIHALSPRADEPDKRGNPWVSRHAAALIGCSIKDVLAEAGQGTFYLRAPERLATSQQLELAEWLKEARNTRGSHDGPRLITSMVNPVATVVASGQMVAELARQIDVFRIRVPDLAERSEDIVWLSEAARASVGDYGITVCSGFTNRALTLLKGHSWPGNLRQLQGAIQAASLMARGGAIDDGHLRQALSPPQAAEAPAPKAGPVQPLEDVIRMTLLDALERHEGNVTAASRELDISKVTLYRRLERFTDDTQTLLDSFRA